MIIGTGEALSLGCALAWATGVIIYKRLGEDVPPLKLCLLKNLIVLVLVAGTVSLLLSPMADALGLARLAPPRLDGAAVAIVVASGVLGIAVADTLYLRALNLLGAGQMGIVGNLFSPFVIALSFVFLGERMTALQFGGFLLVMAGVLMVNPPAAGGGVSGRERWRAIAFGALSVALMAVAIVMVKRVLETEPFWWIVLLRVAGAVAGLLLVVALSPRARSMLRGSQRPLRWAVLLLAAFVGQYVSMTMWLAGYKYTDASIASVLNESSSIFIVLFAAIFLGEALTRRRLLGVAVTFAGVVCMIP
jgi:drug/metabolite transporter (DMT)-like permease